MSSNPVAPPAPAPSTAIEAEMAAAAAAAGHVAPGEPPVPASSGPAFAVLSVGVNQFRITESGRPLGKILAPTEVPLILGWLRTIGQEIS